MVCQLATTNIVKLSKAGGLLARAVSLLFLITTILPPAFAALTLEELKAIEATAGPVPWKPRKECNRYAAKPIRVAIVCSIEALEEVYRTGYSGHRMADEMNQVQKQIERRQELLAALDAKQISPTDAKRVFRTIDESR